MPYTVSSGTLNPTQLNSTWTNPQTPLPASSLDPCDLWCQTASASDPPFCHNALDRPTDARTYRLTDRPRESLTTIGRCATRATRPNNTGLWLLTRQTIELICRNAKVRTENVSTRLKYWLRQTDLTRCCTLSRLWSRMRTVLPNDVMSK